MVISNYVTWRKVWTAVMVIVVVAFAVNVVFALAARAEQGPRRGCLSFNQSLYPGMKASMNNARLAELTIHAKGCQTGPADDWRARDGAGTFTADIEANSVSIMAGYEWHLKTPVLIEDDRWSTSWRVDGSYRDCLVYQSPICGPTGTFRYVLTYRTHGLTRFGAPSWDWNVWPTNSWAEDTLQIWKTP